MIRWRQVVVILATIVVAGPTLAGPPVAAVDQIQVQGIDLSPRAREVLADFLALRLAATNRYRIIPRPQVKESIARFKQRAAETCAAQDCLVELGKELAASTMIQARVIKIAGRCSLSLTQYDVRSATAELASSVEGSCSEPDLATAVDRAVAELVNKGKQTAATQPAGTIHSPRQVSVYFTSFPTFAAVTIDGEDRGRTPLRVDLDAGRRYALSIAANWPYAPFEKSFEARDWQRIHARLHYQHVDPRELASTTEWVGLGLGSGFFANDMEPLFAISFRLATLRFSYFFVSLADMSVGQRSNDIKRDGESVHTLRALMSIGSRPGLYWSPGSTGRHQIMLGIGAHYSSYEGEDPDTGATLDSSMLTLSPGIEYVYQASNGTLSLGGEIRGVLPVAGRFHGETPPYQLLFSLRAGLSLSPMLRAHRRQQPAHAKGMVGDGD